MRSGSYFCVILCGSADVSFRKYSGFPEVEGLLSLQMYSTLSYHSRGKGVVLE